MTDMRKLLVMATIALLGVALVFAAGFGVGRLSEDSGSAASSKSAEADVPRVSEAEEQDEEESLPEFDVDDFTLDVKITDKQCFGSAGCNVQFRVDPTYLGAVEDLEGRDIDMTFVIKGDESGPQVGTIYLSNGSYDQEIRTASTSSNGVKITARMQSVTAY